MLKGGGGQENQCTEEVTVQSKKMGCEQCENERDWEQLGKETNNECRKGALGIRGNRMTNL